MKSLKRLIPTLIAVLMCPSCMAKQDDLSTDNSSVPQIEHGTENSSSPESEDTAKPLIDPLMVKENNLLLFQPENKEQDIYILGTIHSGHFIKDIRYSFANVQSVIDTINPDILLVEIRQRTLEAYSALDGPVDMIFAYSYAKEKDIEVKGIDWWEVTDDSRPLTTNVERDDHIFENILSEINGKQKVLILCGATHRVEQGKRFANNGYVESKLQNIEQYFGKVPEDIFTYPATMASEIQKKIAYLETAGTDEIKLNTNADSETQKVFLDNMTNLINATSNMNDELIIPNKLYDFTE